MPPLFRPILSRQTVETAREELIEKHREVSAAGREALAEQGKLAAGYSGRSPDAIENSSGWGTAMKRVAAGVDQQPMAEVVNQCATVERLLDALAWAESESPRGVEPAVLLVHPGTSSSRHLAVEPDQSGNPVPDHDLVLEVGDEIWIFEVSDIASTKDNNGKNRKDSDTLRATFIQRRGVRAFLVTSPERVVSLERNPGYLGSEEVAVKLRSAEPGGTAIYELLDPRAVS